MLIILKTKSYVREKMACERNAVVFEPEPPLELRTFEVFRIKNVGLKSHMREKKTRLRLWFCYKEPSKVGAVQLNSSATRRPDYGPA